MDKEKFLFIDIGTEDLKTLIGVSQSKTITLTPQLFSKVVALKMVNLIMWKSLKTNWGVEK